MSDWQPIDTAPVVGFGAAPVYVLLYGPCIGICTGRACSHSDGFVFAGVTHVSGNLAGDDVTHWMPLPDPPSAESAARSGKPATVSAGSPSPANQKSTDRA